MGMIAVGGFMHETNTFNAHLTGIDAFRAPSDRPGLCEGNAVVAVPGKFVTSLNGFLGAVGDTHDIYPLAWASALAGGRVMQDAFEDIVGKLITALRRSPDLAGVYLELHGAMATQRFDDGEGELLSRVRAAVGEAVPIVVSLDYHANISPKMVQLADGFATYRTYPHSDQIETGRRAAQLLQCAIDKGRPTARAMRQSPFLLAINYQSTLQAPTDKIVDMAVQLESEAVPSISYSAGFPSADVTDCGPSIAAFGYDQAEVDAAVDAVFSHFLSEEENFIVPMYDADEAVKRAISTYKAVGRPVMIADTQDNPGCGAAGDTTGLIHLLRDTDIADVTIGALFDPISAQAAQAAGIGNLIELSLGGASDPNGDPPVGGLFEVVAIHNEAVRLDGPLGGGRMLDLSPLVLLRHRGLNIIVSGKRGQIHDTAILRAVGIDPQSQNIIVLKSGFHYRADFDQFATANIVALANGGFQANPAINDYQNLRPGVRPNPRPSSLTTVDVVTLASFPKN